MAVADLNQDGKPDLVYSLAAYDMSVSINTGNGTSAPSAVYTPVVAGTEDVAAADFNNDGYPDVAVAAIFQAAVGVLLNTGTGTGALGAMTTYPTSGGAYSVTTGALNADGLADIAYAANSNNSINILLGTGGGGSAPYVYYAAGNGPTAVAVADFNADGKQDVAVVIAGDSVVSLFTGTGTGTLNARTTYAWGAAIQLLLSDVGGDGRTDLVASNSGSLGVLVNNGSGGFNAPISYTSAGVGFDRGDFNGDGHMDMMSANGNNIVVYLYNSFDASRP